MVLILLSLEVAVVAATAGVGEVLVTVTVVYTVNPLYNDIRYNSKIRYNVNSVCTKISGFFFINSHISLF